MWVKHGKTLINHLGMVTIAPIYGDDWGMVQMAYEIPGLPLPLSRGLCGRRAQSRAEGNHWVS